MVGTLTFWVDAIFVTLGIAMAILVMVTPWTIAGAADRKFFPDDDAIERGSKYFCQIDRNWGSGSHCGKVWDVHDVIRWQFGTRRNPLGRSRGNPLNKPDFVFTAADGEYELIIRRVSFFPSVFHMLEEDQFIGQICLCNVVQYKYVIEVEGSTPWTFRLRLFTGLFCGGSENDPRVWVRVGPSKMDLSMLIKPGLQDRPLVAALAFIHTEWWNYV